MPSLFTSLATFALAVAPAVASSNYNLAYRFDETNFFQNFSFYSDADPTHGYVQYLDYEAAQAAGLATIKSGNVYLGADSTNTYTTGGRPSTRVVSNVELNEGLIIADIAHMPGNACGVWPAFWTTGSQWPNDGEIDIIEGINLQQSNEAALHTLGTCDITASQQTGDLTATACSTANGTSGCTVLGTEGDYGDSFNSLGGGVYAVEWTSQFIKIWFFPRLSIPACITSGNPDTSQFGTPMAFFQGSCDFQESFTNQQIVFNTDFCGDWAGNSYGSSTTCPGYNSTDPVAACEAYVGANPTAFVEAYWEIVSVAVYQQSNTPQSSVSVPSSSRVIPASSSAVRSSSSSIVQSALGAGTTRTAPTTSSCSSSSTVTVTSVVAPTTSAFVAQTTSSCSSKSTVTVTSLVPSGSSGSTTSVAPIVTTSPVQFAAAALSSSSSKLTTTTIITTSYVDVCPTGYTTKTVTQTVTYCPADVTSSSIVPNFTTTSKACPTGCGSSPTTVVVVVPVETSTTPAEQAGTLAALAAPTSAPTSTSTITITSTSTMTSTSTFVGVVSSVPTSVLTSGVSVSPAPSSVIFKPSGSLLGSGSVTTTAVSPAFTGAGSRVKSSAVGVIAAVAAFVLLF